MKTIHYHPSFYKHFKKIQNNNLFFNLQDNLLKDPTIGIFLNDNFRYVLLDHYYIIFTYYNNHIMFITITSQLNDFINYKQKFTKWVNKIII
jgi:hypothetical protein